jgi:uncharacterized protein (TIGR03000 family)
MQTRRWLALGLVTLLGTGSLSVIAQEKAKEKKAEEAKPAEKKKVETKVSEVKVLVPADAEVELTFDGVKTRATGETRTFKTPPLSVGEKYTYKVEALIIPNNYTKITRPREITVTGGEDTTVDLRTENKELDKIVVRWVPTPNDVVDEMAKLARITKDDVVYDLGCGDAVMLIRPIKNIGAKKGVGIDIDPKMVAEAQERVIKEGLKDKIEIRQGDILDVKDMPEATVVLLYIGDDLGARLEPVLKKTLKPGARIVSHRFKLGGWKPEKTITVVGKDGEEYTLHLWEVKEAAPAPEKK